MSDKSKHLIKRAGFVCPACRIIFALPSDIGGNGASCPGCSQLLTVPTTGDKVSALGSSTVKYGEAKVMRREGEIIKQHRTLAPGEHHEWADSKTTHSDKGMKIMIPFALLTLVLIGGLAYVLLSDKPDEASANVMAGNEDRENKQQNIESTVTSEDEDRIYIYNPNDKAQSDQLEEFLTGFFSAKFVDDLLPYVRPTENIKEKMINFYGGEQLDQSPYKQLDVAVNTSQLPHFLSFKCQTVDYNVHIGILKYTRDEILLDWESYVGYSDMSWDELREKKPTDLVRLRVTVQRAHYYNDDFSDEQKWQAVSLISPDEKEAIYGYVEKGSAEEQLLFNFGSSNNRKMILDVHYPEDAKKNNQVFIKSVVASGWIITDEK